MIRGIARWHVFIPNEAALVAKSALGPHGANPPHIHMTQEKIGQFFKAGATHEIRVRLGVDGPHKAAGHPQDTPKTPLLLPASGSQSALYLRFWDRKRSALAIAIELQVIKGSI